MRLQEIIYCEINDRLIYIKRDFEGDIIGLNYVQGDDVNVFDKLNDQKLLIFYKAFKNHTQGLEVNELQRINRAIWMKFEYDEYDELNYE